MLDNYTSKENISILEAIKAIDTNARGVLFIINEENKVIGLLTDGDIRRAILNGHELSDSIKSIVNRNFTKGYVGQSSSELLELCSESILIIPILDENGCLADVFHYDSRVHIPVASPNLSGNEFKYLVDAFLSTWISSAGKYINQFETGFASFCGVKHGVATSNGTVAIHLALEAVGIGVGDEVIVPDLTFAATINAVLHAGATPVIVDIEEESWCIDPSKIEQAITSKTKAIIPVHIYGQPCDMEAIMKIAKAHNLKVIEDAAEAHGAKFNGQRVGSFGDIACFSFFGNKVITTGEGGMCITNSDELDEKMRVLRDHGMSKSKKYWHDQVGYNYRLTNLQASIGVAQLERIDQILATKANYEKSIIEALKGIDHIEFQRANIPHRDKIVWLTCILVTNGKRDEYLTQLKEAGIDARPFFYSLEEMDIF